jgi:3,4-dihydroxy 2-butanone 4-phosphate synthase / GTP cyclohydrolase II
MNAAAVRLDAISDALEQLQTGKPIIVVDDEDRENEGDLIFAASLATDALVAFMVRYTSGYICVGMQASDLERLGLPPMTIVNEDKRGTAYSVTVDARSVESTGISAADRAQTMRVLADPASIAADLLRPGHVLPLSAVAGGVLRRPGHTEAAVDLMTLAGLPPAGALCEMMNDDGSMMNAAQCRDFADQHGLLMISIADLIRFRRQHGGFIQRVAQAELPTEYGAFQVVGFRNVIDETEHVALVMGDITPDDDVLVRVHVECLTGDVFSAQSCACGEKLRHAMTLIAAEGRGVIIYVRSHGSQSLGNHQYLDELDYGTGSQMLHDLGVRRIRLITSQPDREYSLSGFGLQIVEAVPASSA